jgi:glycosyltransferase involved in cell wall biosynthesis
MGIVIVHPSLNRCGGAERVCLATIRALSRRYRVRLATVERTDWHFVEGKFGGVIRPFEETYIVKGMPIQGGFSQAFFTLLFFIPRLFSYWLMDGDVIINTCGDLIDSIADISYINAVPVRVMHRYSESGYPSYFGWKFTASAYDLSLKVVDGVLGGGVLLANSTFIRDIVRRSFKRDSFVVYPPVDVEKFQSSAVSKRENLVVTVSRFRPGKRLNLIPRIAKLVGRGEFIIAGVADGASWGTVKELKSSIKDMKVGGHVKLFINQPFQKLVKVLASAKVFLQTQLMEAFGMSVVEAMAAGCVPLVPCCGGPWFDILECRQGVYGFSYSNMEEAAETINRLLEDNVLRESVAASARERALAFNTSIFEKKILDVVDRVYRLKFGK